MAADTDYLFERLVLLRSLVGYLGEKSQYNWWDTNFLSPTGLQFLNIIFPRSAFAAGCNSVSEAAKRLHDERIGRRGVYHLFRFTVTIEESIHNQLRSTDPEVVLLHLKDKQVALTKLREFSQSTIDAPHGPVQVGKANNMLSKFAIEELAKHYYDVFSNGKMCFPYFTGE